MSLAVGVVSSSNCKSMGFDDKDAPESGDERGSNLSRHVSEGSIAVTEEEDDEVDRRIDLGPQCTLKEQLEKDKVLFYSFILIACVFICYTLKDIYMLWFILLCIICYACVVFSG